MLLAVTLIGNEARPLTDKDVEEAVRQLERHGIGVNGREWLSHNEACDIFVEGEVDEVKQRLEKGASGRKLDLIVQIYRNRRKKALLADMESTIIEQEMLDEIAKLMGIGPQVEEITRRAMNNEINFREALKERLALLADTPYNTVQELTNKITYMPGAKELLGTLKAYNVHCVLVSGGFTVFTEAVAKKLKFDMHFGNQLGVKNGVLTGLPVDPVLGKEAKLAKLKEIASNHLIKEEDVCAIGDGANDIPMLQAAGLGIAFRGKPAVVEAAPYCLRYADLRGVLWAQGYRREEIVSV